MCCLGWYVIGVISGICGPGAIAATTIAVDSVFISHLQKQLVALRGNDPAAVSAIFAIAAEEQQHHDRYAANVPPDAEVAEFGRQLDAEDVDL